MAPVHWQGPCDSQAPISGAATHVQQTGAAPLAFAQPAAALLLVLI